MVAGSGTSRLVYAASALHYVHPSGARPNKRYSARAVRTKTVRCKTSAWNPGTIFLYFYDRFELSENENEAGQKVQEQVTKSKTRVPWRSSQNECRFCGSNTVPPEYSCRNKKDRSWLQSGALPDELKRLRWDLENNCTTYSFVQPDNQCWTDIRCWIAVVGARSITGVSQYV
jgi:hypothetical protein